MRVFFHTPIFADACSYYRGFGPFSRLEGITLVTPPPEMNWTTVIGCQAAVLTRPFKDQHLSILEMISKQKIPIWLDYDDNLFDVQQDNPAFDTYKDQRPVLEALAKKANIITVTTDTLADIYSTINPQAEVVKIPNAWDDILWGSPYKEVPKNKTVFWRGSNTHIGELMGITPAIQKLYLRDKDIQFVFMGMRPWWLNGYVNYTYIPAMDLIDYFNFMLSVEGASTCIVPLNPSEFNKAKSNINWIEATMMGAAVLAPKSMPSFNMPGVTLYDDNLHDFANKLEDMIYSPDTTYQDKRKESYDHILENYLLSVVNKQRAEILASI